MVNEHVMMQPQPYAPGTVFEVQDTPEFQRVLNLPRRDWEEAAKSNDLYKRMTAVFKMPQGTQELRLIQASALADAHDMRGLFAPIRVGEGKTLASFLLPTVIPGVKRPTLLVPASLVEKTWREFQVLQKHWVAHPSYMTRSRFDEAVITYEILGRDSGKDKLNTRRPDMLIADEVHKLRNRQAACTKRVERFMLANPETIFCGMSGTITKRSVRDYWHVLYWALKHCMPLPRTEAEMEKWADALDEKKTDGIGRRGTGALIQFCNEEEKLLMAPPARTAPVGRTQQMPAFNFREKLSASRKGYQRRLRDSPGVICSSDRNLDCSLLLRRLDVEPPVHVQAMLENLRETMETPNGDLLSTPMDVWRHARELATGFWYKWSPPPPSHWVAARKNWNWVVQQTLQPDGIYHHTYAHLNLDSPMQVGLAVGGAEYTDVEGEVITRGPTIVNPDFKIPYERWQAVKKDYRINTVAEWVDDFMLDYCLDWMKTNQSGIVWCEHRAFGKKLAEMLGTGFCSTKGEDANGNTIESYEGAPVVASVQANSEGRNLQAWNRNLIVTMMPTGTLGEQLLGRTHRMGQLADTVYCDWICACDEQDAGFQQMLADATYIQDSTGQSQKLLYADHV
jgi:hypothetical protein